MLWRGAEWKLKKCGRTSCVLRAPNGSVLPFTHMGVSVSSKKQQNTDDNDIDDNLCSRDDTSMQLFHFPFSILHSLVMIVEQHLENENLDNENVKRRAQYWREQTWLKIPLLASSTITVLYPDSKAWKALHPVCTSWEGVLQWLVLANADIRSKAAKKQVGDVFLLQLFVQYRLILRRMLERPLNVNTWLIKFRGKEFLISELKKGYI